MGRNKNSALIEFDPIRQFTDALRPEGSLPWDSIVDFATHPSFCDQRMYPRQLTLLKLIYLETDNMTAFDVDVIEQWRAGWRQVDAPFGVQEDIWERVKYLKDRGYRHFPHTEALIGRRGSKGHIGGILGAEKLAQMYALDNWQDHYGIARGKDGYASVVATSLAQAKKFQFADIRAAIESCKYLEQAVVGSSASEILIRTPADMRRLAYMKAKKMPIDHTIASLHVVAMSSNSSSGRGGTGFANFYDEFAHMVSGTGSQKSSEEIYEAYQPSLDQFKKDSLTYIPTSPFTKVGKAYSLYKEGSVLMTSYNEETGRTEYAVETVKSLGTTREEQGQRLVELTANPEMLVIQLPSWGLYEDYQKAQSLGYRHIPSAIQEYDERLKRAEQSNPEKFAVERRAQFASVMDAYLNPRSVEKMFAVPDWRDPLGAQQRGRMDIKYRIHVDPSLSNANFAVCVAHLENAPADDHGEIWPHVVVDFLHVWKPEDFENNTIDYVFVTQQLSELLDRFPSTDTISFDQWNSAGPIATLKQKHKRIRIIEETFGAKYNDRRMERFKTALNLGWIHAYRDNFFDGEDDGSSLLEMELKFLQRKKNGKVDKQDFGPVTTKDLADTLMVVTDKLLEGALDRWEAQTLGLTNTAVGSSDAAALRGGREQDRVNAFNRGPSNPTVGWGSSDERKESTRDRLRALSGNRMGLGDSSSLSSLRRSVR